MKMSSKMVQLKRGVLQNRMNDDVKKTDIEPTKAETDPSVVNTTEKQRQRLLGGVTGKGFMPGESGNPNGRPKGTRNLNTIVTEALQKMAKDTKGNPMLIEEALVQKIIKMALDGDRKMIELIWNYRDGKPPQNIDVTSKGARVGTVVLTADEERRIEELFAPRKLLETTKQNGNDTQPSNDGGNRSGNNGGLAVPQAEQPRGAYEGNS